MKRTTQTKTNTTAAAAGRGATQTAAPRTAGTSTYTRPTGGWVDLGSVRERKGKDGQDISYLVIDKDVEIFVGGEKVDLGEFRTVKLIDPRQGLETALSNGKIDEEKYNERLETLNNKNILFKMTVPPANN